MREKVIRYKNSMVKVFKNKYGISEFEAKKLIREYDFNTVVKKCNYLALHDDPEVWVDEIYDWANIEHELLEM